MTLPDDHPMKPWEQPAPSHEAIQWRAHATVHKYRAGEAEPYAVEEHPGNLLMYGGASLLWERLIGTSVTAFNNANAYLAVGNSSFAATPTQGDMQGTAHREAMDATYPIHTSGATQADASIVFKSTYEDGDAEFAWQEWGLFNHVSDQTNNMLNRKVFSGGTKAPGDVWSLTVTLTLA